MQPQHNEALCQIFWGKGTAKSFVFFMGMFGADPDIIRIAAVAAVVSARDYVAFYSGKLVIAVGIIIRHMITPLYLIIKIPV